MGDTMKKIRIGCGSGGCTYERLEPAIELLEKGNLDYLVFECLAERTLARLQREKLKNPSKGYNPMLEVRMRRLLKTAKEKGTKIISNMGGANTPAAVEAILNIAKELGLNGLKVAMVTGDDILDRVKDYYQRPLWEADALLESLDGKIIAANVYLSGDPIKEALEAGADVVITGRVADPSLFVGPLKYEFGWTADQKEKMGQALLLGHLMECAGQLTGGYYADPGYKDVENLHILGLPIAEIDESADFIVTKVEGSGGFVSVDVCKEQMLYEIGDPSHYITPDGIADFSQVSFVQQGKDVVQARGGRCKGEPADYKVNVSYKDCFIGEASLSFGGSTAINRARLAAEIVEKRLQVVGGVPDEYRVDYIGYNSLYLDAVSSLTVPEPRSEIRLRIAARTQTAEEATAVVREVECMYINGPAGSSGIVSSVEEVVSMENILVPRSDVVPQVTFCEVRS